MGYFYEDELTHHGIKGQKWGIRRYQNPDGTLTAQGRKRLSQNAARAVEKVSKKSRQGYSSGDNQVSKAIANQLRGKVSLESIHQKKKELHDFQKTNSEAIRKAMQEIDDKSWDSKNIDNEVKRIADKQGIKKNEIWDNIEWLQEEARMNLESKYEKEYQKSALGKKEKQLVDAVMKEYENVGKNALGEYGNTPLKNVYTYKSGKKEQAYLEDAITFALYDLDRENEKGIIE